MKQKLTGGFRDGLDDQVEDENPLEVHELVPLEQQCHLADGPGSCSHLLWGGLRQLRQCRLFGGLYDLFGDHLLRIRPRGVLPVLRRDGLQFPKSLRREEFL